MAEKLAPVMAQRLKYRLARRWRVRHGGRLDLAWLERIKSLRLRKRAHDVARPGLVVLS